VQVKILKGTGDPRGMNDESIFSLLFSGRFDRPGTRIHWQATRLNPPAELTREIDRHWRDIADRGHFNGTIARLEDWTYAPDRLELFLRPTDYKTQLYSNYAVDEIVAHWGEPHLARALGISAVVNSRDHQILVMKRSETVGEYPGCYDVFGGHIDCPASDPPDVFAAMAAELREELALEEYEVVLYGYGLISAVAIRKPELLFTAQADLTADEILARAQTARDRNEYGSLQALPDRADAIGRFMSDHRDEISPSAYGCLAVYREQMRQHGRRR